MLMSGDEIGTGTATAADNGMSLNMASYTVLMLDVNPSLKMEINDRGVVVKYEAINDDAKELELDAEVVGKGYETAVTNSVKALQDKDYITNLKNSMLITVMDADKDKAESIKSKAVDAIEKVDKDVEYHFSILSQTMDREDIYNEIAREFSISPGRAKMISEFCDEVAGYAFEDLVGSNIQTLNQLFEYTEIPKSIEKIGEAAGIVPKEYREKLGLKDLSGAELVDFTSAVSDFYNKLCDYYDEADVAKRIGYAFNIAEGKNQTGDKLWAVMAESMTKNIKNHAAIINIGEETVSNWSNPRSMKEVTKALTGIPESLNSIVKSIL